MTLIKRRLLGMVFTVAVGVGLGAVIYWQTERAAQHDGDAKPKVLEGFDPKAVKQLELETPAGSFVARREGLAHGTDSWRLISPLSTRGDNVVINGLLEALTKLEVKREVGGDAASLDEGVFGLEPPRFRVVLATSDGKRQALRVGTKNTFDDTLYAKREGGGRVVMVSAKLEAELDQSLLGLRNKSLLDVTLDEVSQLEIISRGQRGFALRREAEGGWRLALAGRELLAGSERVDALFAALSYATAKEFVVEKADQAALAKYGLDHPKATLVITVKQGPARRVLFSKIPHGGLSRYYATAEAAGGPIMELASNAALEKLTADPTTFRDHTIATFELGEVAALELLGEGKTLAFARTKEDGGDVWRLVRPEEAEADAATLSGLLRKLRGLEAVRIERDEVAAPRLRAYGLDAPTLTITLKKADGHKLAELLFGKVVAKEQYITAAGSGRVDVVPAALARDFALDVEHYRARAP